MPTVAITRIEDYTGKTVYEYQPAGRRSRSIRPEHAYLINSILSDNAARTPAFGPNSVLNLPFPAAVKTGTTERLPRQLDDGLDARPGRRRVDRQRRLFTPMGKIYRRHRRGADLECLHAVRRPAPDEQQSDRPSPGRTAIVDQAVCALSGAEPSEWCPDQRLELFAQDQPPLPRPTRISWQRVWVDSFSLELASDACRDYAIERVGLAVTDPWAQKWLKDNFTGTRRSSKTVWASRRKICSSFRPGLLTPTRRTRWWPSALRPMDP